MASFKSTKNPKKLYPGFSVVVNASGEQASGFEGQLERICKLLNAQAIGQLLLPGTG
jgi:hypothetical protein